jgi:hypothetical protein
MDAGDVEQIVEAALDGTAFDNFHGITPENVRRFLVEPRLVDVAPDDGEPGARTTPMWIVLAVRPPDGGHLVVFDPASRDWGVAESTRTGYVLIVTADSLAGALDGM